MMVKRFSIDLDEPTYSVTVLVRIIFDKESKNDMSERDVSTNKYELIGKKLKRDT